MEPTHPFTVFYSLKQFKRWFLTHYDFTIFSEDEVSAFFEESASKTYPCIPFYGENGSFFPTHYIDVSQVKIWNEEIKVSTYRQ